MEYKFAMKKIIRNTARRAGFSIMKYPASPFPVMPVFRICVQYLMAAKGEVLQFVQIGANDGVFGDPLRDFVVKFPWRGIVIEPQPEVFSKLRANYDAQKERLILENVAISDHSGTITMYALKKEQGANLTTLETSASSADPRIAGKQLHSNCLQAFTVPCLTLNDLLDKHSMTAIDILQIDVEGHEFKILSALDFSRYTPLLIQFETGNLSPKEIDRTVQCLTKSNYRIFYGGIQMDTLAIHKSFPLDCSLRPAVLTAHAPQQ